VSDRRRTRSGAPGCQTTDMAEPVVLINAFEVPAADAETFITAWEKARDYLRTQPGYIDTVLHQALTPDAEFQFVNVARWRTAEDFMAATRSPGFRESASGLAGSRPHPALYRSVRT
jgi:heme-degrading monooxygenase HmoA